MSKFYNSAINETATIFVRGQAVVDVSVDENGKSVMSEQYNAAVVKTETADNGATRITDSVKLDLHEIDVMIEALKEVKQEIIKKRMKAATEWFINNRREEEEAAAAAHAALMVEINAEIAAELDK